MPRMMVVIDETDNYCSIHKKTEEIIAWTTKSRRWAFDVVYITCSFSIINNIVRKEVKKYVFYWMWESELSQIEKDFKIPITQFYDFLCNKYHFITFDKTTFRLYDNLGKFKGSLNIRETKEDENIKLYDTLSDKEICDQDDGELHKGDDVGGEGGMPSPNDERSE